MPIWVRARVSVVLGGEVKEVRVEREGEVGL